MPSSPSNTAAKPARRPGRLGRFVVPLVGLTVVVAGSLAGAAEFDAYDPGATDLTLSAANGTIAADRPGVEVPAEAVEQVVAVSDVCREADEDCREALGSLRDKRLASIDLDIRIGGAPGNDYPCECRLEGEAYQPRKFACMTFTWKAAGYCHKPLYFEDWNLERYGHSHGWADPIISGAHFFATLPVLPYKMGVELPWECVYPLGYYRPGSCAPWTVPAVPISKRGLAVEAATVTGLVFLLP